MFWIFKFIKFLEKKENLEMGNSGDVGINGFWVESLLVFIFWDRDLKDNYCRFEW